MQIIPPISAKHFNLAATEHARAGNFELALQLFQREHALVPDGRALADVAQVEVEQGNIEAAVENFRHSAELLDTPAAWSQYLSWGLHAGYDEAGHRRWASRFAGEARSRSGAEIPTPRGQARSEGRIRVGYWSASFADCACGHFLRPVVGNHDPDRVEVVCYSNVHGHESWTERFKAKAARWRDVAEWPDENVLQQILADDIEVLVDVEGHKRQGRPGVLAALRSSISPVVLSYIGYAAPTFLATNIDAIGWAWQPHDDPPPITPLPFDRNGYVTFGHIGRACKITLPVARLWARVLAAVPGGAARLTVWAIGGEKNAALRRRLVECGIPGERLLLIDRRPALRDYLADISEIDLSLDTFPFAGCATTCELLWQGVPTVTLAEAQGTCSLGAAPYQKIGPMLARAAGLPGLIVQSEDAYVEKAVEMAARSFSLGAMRSTMRDRLKSSPLLDGRAIARKLEDAYEVAARGLELPSC